MYRMVRAFREFMTAIIFQRRMNVYMEHGDTVDDLATLCERYQNSLINGDEFLVGVRTLALLIYPGIRLNVIQIAFRCV